MITVLGFWPDTRSGEIVPIEIGRKGLQKFPTRAPADLDDTFAGGGRFPDPYAQLEREARETMEYCG
jgi:hypothetical protein